MVDLFKVTVYLFTNVNHHHENIFGTCSKHLSGGFRYILCSTLLREMIQFDLRIFFRLGWLKPQPRKVQDIYLKVKIDGTDTKR